jgi:hypothetical protein
MERARTKAATVGRTIDLLAWAYTLAALAVAVVTVVAG